MNNQKNMKFITLSPRAVRAIVDEISFYHEHHKDEVAYHVARKNKAKARQSRREQWGLATALMIMKSHGAWHVVRRKP